MAIYRFEAQIIGRRQGRCATAAAAYRSAGSIADQRTGLAFDYTRKRGVLHSEILAPAGTPDWMQDRAQLWNAVEKVEKRKDAQLAREILLSLPHELSPAQRIELVRDFVGNEFVGQGMIADISIHAPHRKGDDRNQHAHVLLTTRELMPTPAGGSGFGKKQRAWNDPEQLGQWRAHWADAVNRHLERYGHDVRVDHRSLADQGVDREPEPKQGPVATEMERDGRSSHAGDDRRAAQARNEERVAIEAELATVTAEIINLQAERIKQEPNAVEASPDDIVSAEQTQEARRALVREEGQGRQQAAPTVEAPPVETVARKNADRQVHQAEELRLQRARLNAFEADQKHRAEEACQEEERRRADEGRGRAAEAEVRDAADRYRIALGNHYDVMNPYGSLARAAMAEYGAFVQDRERLTQQIVKEQDPQARRALELRKQIEEADYMAITDRRIATQSEVITGRRDSEEAVRHRERAGEFEAQSKVLRQEYRDLQSARALQHARSAEQDNGSSQKGERPGRGASSTEEEKAARILSIREEGRHRRGEGAAQPETSATKEAKAVEHELTKGEISESKAARIDKIRAEGREARAEQARQVTQPTKGGGRTR